MSAARRRLTDDQLASTELRIDAPMSVEGYSRDRPDPELTPEIVGEYELTPAGGRVANPDGPWTWCCHCQEENHWRGFLVANASRRRYSVGKDCAAKHYGVSFVGARRTFKDEIARKGLLERLRASLTSAPGLNSAISAILHSEGLAIIDAKRREIATASPNAALLLANAANIGAQLYEDVRVRDFAAERVRDENDRSDVEKAAIFTFERRGLGLLEGVALVRDRDDCRDRMLRLRAAIDAAELSAKTGTDEMRTRDLQKIVVEIGEAHRAAVDGVAECGRVLTFFSPQNGERLARWSSMQSGFDIVPVPSGLEFRSARDNITVKQPTFGPLPELPPLAAEVGSALVAVDLNAPPAGINYHPTSPTTNLEPRRRPRRHR